MKSSESELVKPVLKLYKEYKMEELAFALDTFYAVMAGASSYVYGSWFYNA